MEPRAGEYGDGEVSRALIAFGDALRRARARRRRLLRRGLVVAAGAAALGLTIVFPPAPRLVWNTSASAPIGLYWVAPGAAVARGDMVVARVPERYRPLAAARRYLPMNVPLVKRVAAGPGEEVCALGSVVFVDGAPVADRLAIDGRGREMPRWQGCRTLKSGQFLLLMTDHPASFDGRYFGISEGSDIVGRARLLWAR